MSEQVAGSVAIEVGAQYAQFLADMKKLETIAVTEASKIGKSVAVSMARAQSAATQYSSPIGPQMPRSMALPQLSVISAESIQREFDAMLPKLRAEAEKKLVPIFGAAGDKSGKEFAKRAERNMYEAQAGRAVGAAFGIMAADRFARELAASIEKGEGIASALGTAFQSALSSTPVIGAAFELGKSAGSSLYDWLSGEGERARQSRMANAAADQYTKQQEAIEAKRLRIEQENARMVAEARSRANEAMFAEEERFAAESAKGQIDAARDAGNERLAIELELAESLRKLEQDRINALGEVSGGTQEDFDAIQAMYAQHQERIRAQAVRRIDAVAAEEAKAAQEAADERLAWEIEMARDEFRIMQENEARIADLERERIESQSAGMSSASTVLGSFRFDAYPAAEKRRVDREILRALETIKKNSVLAGFN